VQGGYWMDSLPCHSTRLPDSMQCRCIGMRSDPSPRTSAAGFA
jgi:hypothetical protein